MMEALWAESARLRCEDTFLQAAEVLLKATGTGEGKTGNRCAAARD